MAHAIRIGTITSCEVLNRLSQDRYLVRMNGREVVMQTGGQPVESRRLEVQVVDVRNETVFARVLENEHSTEELVRQLGLKLNLPAGDLETVFRFLKTAGLALTEETVKRFLQLRQAWGDRDLALSVLVRGIPRGLVERLMAGASNRDPKQALAAVEKFVINSRNLSEDNKALVDLLHRLNPERVIDLQTSLLVFRPDLERKLWKDLKEQRRDAEHLKLALLGLKRSLRGGEGPADEIEALVCRLNLDNLRSAVTASYEARVHRLWWKDGGDWREAEVVVRHILAEDEYLLDLRTEFPRLGEVGILCRYAAIQGRTEVTVGVRAPAVLELLKRELKLSGVKVEVRLMTGMPDDPGFGSKNWKKIDLVV